MDAIAVATRFGLYIDLGTTFGVAVFALLNPRSRGLLPLRSAFVPAALLGVSLSALSLAVVAASMAGVPLLEVDLPSINMVVTGMSLGAAFMARVASLVVIAVSALAMRRDPELALRVVTSGSAVALASLAWAGHGVAGEGAIGWLHLGADIAHLIAAGAWLGALVCLLFMVTRRADRVDTAHLWTIHGALDQFSLVGTIVVAVILATGIVNVWLLVGPDNVAALPGTLYGQLLIAKLLLFAAMLGFAAANRYRLTPVLASCIGSGDHGGAIRLLRISIASETACAAAVFALVAWLGTLEPLISTT